MARIKKGIIALVVALAVGGIVWAIVWFVVFKKDYDLLNACARCDAGKVQALLESGADPNSQRRGGTTALMLAASCRKEQDLEPSQRPFEPIGDPETVKILIEKGADVKKRYRENYTVLHRAVGRPRHADEIGRVLAQPAPGNPEVIKVLIEAGADVNAVFARYYTPLDAAMHYDLQCLSRDCVRLLIEHGATSFNGEKCDGMDRAQKCGWDDIVELYIQRGCPPP